MPDIIPQNPTQNSPKPKGRPKGIPAHNKQIHPEVICEVCGKTFTVKPYRKDLAKYCSRACNGKALNGVFVGEKNSRYTKVEHACITCGKLFLVKLAYDKKGKYQYCSKECAYPPHVEINCKWCGNPFMVTPGAKERGKRQFCSYVCHGYYSVSVMKAEGTSIEKAVEQVLIDLNEPYQAQKQIGVFLVDFYLPQYKLVIECDGTYWHSLPNVIEKDKRKDHWLAAHRYKILRLPEKDIKANAMEAVRRGLYHANASINSL